ncbi:MAG: DUF6320 domain-containing protein [Oscillospiraceae bacterium]|nr:DUF6320 domain-containing protein [Oscillospiraceae bacterium]
MYCVNCGVELNPGAERCPLCGTPAWKPDPAEPPYFATKPPEVPAVENYGLAILMSSMLLSVALCCGLLNLILLPGRFWSYYVIGAAVMLWVWFVLPMVFRKLPVVIRLTLDVAIVGVYIWLISIDLNGEAWFRGLVVPILIWACVLVFLLCLLSRNRSILTKISLCVGAVALLVIGIEYAIKYYLFGAAHLTWSLVVATICIALIIPLRVIRHVPALREEVRRRFDL